MNRIICTAALGLALAAVASLPSPALAQIYKWVDERGVTHYGEKPPANKGQAMTPRDPTGGASKPAEPAERTEKKLREEERNFQRRQAERNRKAETARREQEKRNSPAAQRARQAECQRATRELAVIRGNPSAHSFAQESRVRDSISRNCP